MVKNRSFFYFGLVLLGGLLLFALLTPLLSSHDLYTSDLIHKNRPPSSLFLCGTDELGRDLLTRCAAGVRLSLLIGFAALFFDLLIGLLYGSVAALLGGLFEETMMRLVDCLDTIPHLLLVTFLTIMLGHGVITVVAAIILTGWIGIARFVRGRLLEYATRDFVRYSYSIGASHLFVFRHHLLPQLLKPLVVVASLSIPSAIFAEAFLSFLGIGLSPPIASLGGMANEGFSALYYYPWRLFFPLGAILLLLLSSNLIAEGLSDGA